MVCSSHSGYRHSRAANFSAGCVDKRCCLHLVLTLHVDDSRNFADSRNDSVEVLYVFDVNGDIDGGTAVAGTDIHVADVGVVVADDGRYLLQHSLAVIAHDGEFDGIGSLGWA